MRTTVACNSNPLPRQSRDGLPEEEGVDGWQVLLTWHCGSSRSIEGCLRGACRFVEAWVAVKRMRGDQEWHKVLQEGKVCGLEICAEGVTE